MSARASFDLRLALAAALALSLCATGAAAAPGAAPASAGAVSPAAAAPSAPAPAPAQPPALFRVLQAGKWGYIDRTGRLAIPPRFDRAEPFSDGLAAVALGDRRGWVDGSGQLVLEPAFEPAGPARMHRPFVDGLAAVKVGRLVGYVDRAGRLAIPARFQTGDDFSNGVALVCEEKVGCGYLDRTGRGVVAPRLMGGYPARNGVACGITMMAMSRLTVELHRLDGTRFPGEFEGCGSFSEGLVPVRIDGAWGYLDGAGRAPFQARFEWAGDFEGGLAPAKDGSGLCGFVDRAGRFAIPPRFRSCFPFADGLARVDLARAESDREHWAFVDRDGTVRIDGERVSPPFDSAADFHDGLAAVAQGGEPFLAGSGPLLGYVDTSGRWIWTPRN